MVPANKILDRAIEEQVDIIGLSGLITPSLDEMVHVAKEMERRKMTLPLMIGGATTSKAHTALRVCPEYSGPIIHVHDASKSVTVVGSLLGGDEASRASYLSEMSQGYDDFRMARLKLATKKPYVALSFAREHKIQVTWEDYQPKTPNQIGRFIVDNISIAELRPYIDWTPFFISWQLAGKYPQILNDEVVGVEASKLFAEAQELLDRFERDAILTSKATFGLFKATATSSDDIIITDTDGVEHKVAHLRQQRKKAAGKEYFCLSDFIAPMNSGIDDYMGAFAVTAGIGIERYLTEFEAALDDYNSIMTKALADRLAEACAEYLHFKVRKEFWGYAPNEEYDNRALIQEKYQGVRPAPGYPACPDHTQKNVIWQLLNPDEIGITLTESLAMFPASSVSGWYFGHPASKYFGLGQIAKDQIVDYAERSGKSLKESEIWLRPNLNY
ncbi:UNVERIFIED_CONTAM: hypothetical protein GTU68_018025 [Idotea baltica]|nr:hypothetical protein [Idotea baltica]